MLRRLAINTGISAGAFVVTSVIMLVLVPAIVGAYGLLIYGLITLARIFLPSATFAVFDFGYSEVSTQVVAQARVGGDWEAARRRLFGVLLIATAVALIVGTALLICVPLLVEALRTPAEWVADFRVVLNVTAFTFVPLLVGLVADGVVKGFEEFRGLRLAEVVSTALYAIVALICIELQASFIWIAISYNFSLLLRLGIVLAICWSKWPSSPAQRLWPSPDEWKFLSERCRAMAANKWLGTGQHQLWPLLVGFMLGPISAALLDVIIRLPRYVKVAFSVLNAAVLPVAARLESAGQSLRRLGEAGILATGGIAIPVCIGGMAFSSQILAQWIGAEYARYGFWQALMFAVPIFNTIVGFGGNMMIVRPDVVRTMSKITLLQIVLQYTIAFTAVWWLAERAFILGQVLALAATFMIQVPILAREKGMPLRVYLRLAPVTAVPVTLAIVSFAIGLPAMISRPLQLFMALGAWLVVNYALLWLVALKPVERAQIRGLIMAPRS